MRCEGTFKMDIIFWSYHVSRVEAGSNTSTVTLRVVGVDEKVILESETVK
jgi:hypothetical protein